MGYREATAQSMPIRVGLAVDRKARYVRRRQSTQCLVAWFADNGSDGVVDDMYGTTIRFQPYEKCKPVDDRTSGRLIMHNAWFGRTTLLRDCVIEPAAQDWLRPFIRHG